MTKTQIKKRVLDITEKISQIQSDVEETKMKTLSIYTRNVLERTGYRKHPYKEVKQVIIKYNGLHYSNCEEELDNPRLKIKFNLDLKTRSLKKVKEYLKSLGMTDADKFIKKTIEESL